VTSAHRLALVCVLLTSVLAASVVALARGGVHRGPRASAFANLQRDVSRYLRADAGARSTVEEIDLGEPGYAQVHAKVGGQQVLLHFYRHRQHWTFEAVNCLSACGTRVPAA
jgi:hypothetical protein